VRNRRNKGRVSLTFADMHSAEQERRVRALAARLGYSSSQTVDDED
jgi:hypothetical protein